MLSNLFLLFRNFMFRLKIYFDEASNADPRRLMQIIEMSKVMLQTVGIEVEYRGHKVGFLLKTVLV